MADNLVCGIDIGSSKISTIVSLLSKDNDDLRVIGVNSVASKGVRKGLIVDIDKVTVALEECVEKAERMAGHKINQSFVSVGGPHISSLNSHGVVAVANPEGEINEEDVDRVIEAARAISLSSTKKIIEISPREYIVNGQPGIKNPVGMSGVRLEVKTHIITASSTSLKNIDRCLSDLGIDNLGFVFSGLAAAESVLTETEKELGVVVVDIGGGKSDLSLYVEGALAYSSSIPVGAKHVTNDIAVGLRVSLSSAEKVKLFLSSFLQDERGGLDKRKSTKKIDSLDINEIDIPENVSNVSSKRLVNDIIAPRLEELFKLIGKEIEKSSFFDKVPSGVVITGGGSGTAGMIEMGKKVVGLPIRLGMPGKVTGLVDEVISPKFATTVGLILYGREHIMDSGFKAKDFNRVLKDLSLSNSMAKMKEFFKQFIP